MPNGSRWSVSEELRRRKRERRSEELKEVMKRVTRFPKRSKILTTGWRSGSKSLLAEIRRLKKPFVFNSKTNKSSFRSSVNSKG